MRTDNEVIIPVQFGPASSTSRQANNNFLGVSSMFLYLLSSSVQARRLLCF